MADPCGGGGGIGWELLELWELEGLEELGEVGGLGVELWEIGGGLDVLLGIGVGGWMGWGEGLGWVAG